MCDGTSSHSALYTGPALQCNYWALITAVLCCRCIIIMPEQSAQISACRASVGAHLHFRQAFNSNSSLSLSLFFHRSNYFCIISIAFKPHSMHQPCLLAKGYLLTSELLLKRNFLLISWAKHQGGARYFQQLIF